MATHAPISILINSQFHYQMTRLWLAIGHCLFIYFRLLPSTSKNNSFILPQLIYTVRHFDSAQIAGPNFFLLSLLLLLLVYLFICLARPETNDHWTSIMCFFLNVRKMIVCKCKFVDNFLAFFFPVICHCWAVRLFRKYFILLSISLYINIYGVYFVQTLPPFQWIF